jgi:hypothetical protein
MWPAHHRCCLLMVLTCKLGTNLHNRLSLPHSMHCSFLACEVHACCMPAPVDMSVGNTLCFLLTIDLLSRRQLGEVSFEGGVWTPLGLACRLGQLDIVRLLLSKGADIERECRGVISNDNRCAGPHMRVVTMQSHIVTRSTGVGQSLQLHCSRYL